MLTMLTHQTISLLFSLCLAAGCWCVSVVYPRESVYVSRAASVHARVTQPLDFTSLDTLAGPRFFMSHQALSVTSLGGIVYVANTTSLQGSPQAMKVKVTWKGPGGEQGGVELTVVLVNTPTCRTHDHIDNLCSALTQRECQRTTCAHGLGRLRGLNDTAARCEWAVIGYSTCSVSQATCPDQHCDPLERLSGNLTCLQDCTRQVLGAGTVAERGHGVKALTSRTFCSCDHLGACSCVGSTTSRATQTYTQTPQPILTSTLPEPKARRKDGCGFKCQTKAAIGIIFLMSSCIFVFLFFSSKQQRNKSRHKVVERSNILLRTIETQRSIGPTSPFSFHSPNPAVAATSDSAWEFPRDSLIIEQCLGEGEFGRVLKARALNIDGVKGETIVAVKTLKETASLAETADLLSEYQTMKEVSHPNVIRLLGACTTTGGPVYIIIEYAQHGSLRTYLRRSRFVCPEPTASSVAPLSYQTLLSFAWQISKGMAYLAENKLVHRDLAARNVLLATGNVCKISDFGLSRDVYEDNAYLKRSKGRVPVKWMALESLADHIYTTKSDVWSYGVVLWELVTLGSSPYPGVAVHNLFHLLRAGYRMEQPHTCTDTLYQLMVDCWQEDPLERPPFWQITHRLETMIEEGANYLPIIVNPTYLADCSPEDDVIDGLGYKVPKKFMRENSTKLSNIKKRYENENAVKEQEYDQPKRLSCISISKPSNIAGLSNDLSLKPCRYAVMRDLNSHEDRGDLEFNINSNMEQYFDKASKYAPDKLECARLNSYENVVKFDALNSEMVLKGPEHSSLNKLQGSRCRSCWNLAEIRPVQCTAQRRRASASD